MEYNNKNDTQKFFDKYLFNKRKTKYISIQPHNKTKNIFVNNINDLIPLTQRNNEQNRSYYKNNNIIGFHLPEHKLVNLKREEAKHLFPNEHINENKKRILNKKYFLDQQKNNSFKNSKENNFPKNIINLENYYLKTEYNNILTIPNEDSKNINILNNNIILKNNLYKYNNTKKIGTNTDSSLFRSNNNNHNNIIKKENHIILPLNIENKKKYLNTDNNGNFMEKYEYYLMNLNKSKNNISEKKQNKYFNTQINYSNKNNDNDNDLLQIKPYKYKKYTLNQEKNIKKNKDHENPSQNSNHLNNYLDDSDRNKLLSKIKSKTINNKLKVNIHLNNYFEEILDKLERKLLCINEKNEDLIKANVVSLLGKENEKLNNDVNKIMNIICKIKNFSFKEKSHNLIPLINDIIIDRKKQKNMGIQKFDNKIDLDDKNNNKLFLLNKDLKVFDLENNMKYEYNDEEEDHPLGNMFYNLIIQKSRRRRFRKRAETRRYSHLNFRTKLEIKSIQKVRRFKSADNIFNNNEDSDSFYIPSIYNNNNKKKKTQSKQINFPTKRYPIYDPSKASEKNVLYFTENLPKLYGDNLFIRNTKNKKINFSNNINKTDRNYKKNNNKEEGNDLKNFLTTYKPKNNRTINKKNKTIKNKNNQSKENITDKEDSKDNDKNKDSTKKNNNKLTKETKDKINTVKKQTFIIKSNKTIKENNNINYNINKNPLTSNNENNNLNYKSKNTNKKRIRTKVIRRFSVLSNIELNNNINQKNDNNNIDNNVIKSTTKNKGHISNNVERKSIKRLSTRFRKFNSKAISKSPKKKRNQDPEINTEFNLDNQLDKQKNMNNYTQYFKFLNFEDKKEDKKNNNNINNYERISSTSRKTKRFNIFKKNENSNDFEKSKNLPTERSLRNFMEKNDDEDKGLEIINEYYKESKFKKKKSNLSKFKNIINKMRDMPIDEYMNYVENYYGRMNKFENNNYCIDEQNRINDFLNNMRKNIEKFKGRQSILQVNCQPIDYIETVGNGLGNNISSINNNSLKIENSFKD